MITRPLELASRLRPAPRSFDWLFFVNAGLIALFFALFGSRFVLAPGFTVLPSVTGSNANARIATHHITVQGERQILAGDGVRDLPGLKAWLEAQAAAAKEKAAKEEQKGAREKLVLLVVAKQGVDLNLIARIASVADEAGFELQVASVEPQPRTSPGRAP